MSIKELVRQFCPPIVFGFLRSLVRSEKLSLANNALPKQFFDRVRSEMEAGRFDFNDKDTETLRRTWKADPSSVPYPEVVMDALKDAVSANSAKINDISYRLPYAVFYDEVTRDVNRHIAKQVHAAVQDTAQSINLIADFGCGLGGCLAEVGDLFPGAQLFGFENSQSAVEWIGKNRNGISAVQIDLETDSNGPVSDTSTPWGEFDLVMCIAVLEHIAQADLAIITMMNSLRSGGVAYFLVPDGRHDNTAQHIHFWSEESWRLFLDRLLPACRIAFGSIDDPDMPGGRYLSAQIIKD